MHNTSYIESPIQQPYEGKQDWSPDYFQSILTHMQQINSTTTTQAYCNLHDNYHSIPLLIESLWLGLWHVLYKLRFLFYAVWPSETMFPALNQVPRYVAEMFPVFFIVAILENGVRLWQGKNTIRTNETVSSLSQGIFQECLRIKVRSIEVLMYCLVWNNLRLATLPWNSLWTWWLCYLAVDFGFYWAHRLAHEVNFIWNIHQAHHSSVEFSVVSALRQAVLQPFTAWFTYMPLALFIPPQIFLAHLQLSELYMAWLHTEIVDTIGPLEYILNTPSHHRVHHSRNPEYIDKNYGGMLIIWDRLFSTFKREDKNNPPVYGLVHPVQSFNPISVQFHPWPVFWRRIKRARGFKNQLKVALYGPGWRPGLNNRLGNQEDLPRIERPVNCYDPQIDLWRNVYVIIHFGLLIFFYHELTLHQDHFSPFLLNLGVFNLIITITSLGLALDNKKSYSLVLETIRCALYLVTRTYLEPIVKHGLSRMCLNSNQMELIFTILNYIFAVSLTLNSAILLHRYITKYHQKLTGLFRDRIYGSKKFNRKTL